MRCQYLKVFFRMYCDSKHRSLLCLLVSLFTIMKKVLSWLEKSFKLFAFCFIFQLEKLIEKNYFLHKSAQEAYKSYVRAYASHSLKAIFNVETLDLNKVSMSFGFKVPPYVDLRILLNDEKSWQKLPKITCVVSEGLFIITYRRER